MLGYLAIMAKGAEKIDDDGLRYLSSLGQIHIGRECTVVSSVWLDAARKTCAILWSRKPLDLDSAFGAGGGHFFLGYIREGSRCWQSEELANFNSSHRETSVHPLDLGGVFGLVSARPGRVEALTTISNLYQSFYGENDDFIFLASKAAIVDSSRRGGQLLSAGGGQPDPLRLASMVACRWMANADTAYTHVSMVPANSRLIIANGEVRTEGLSELVFDGEASDIPAAFVEEAAHELLQSVACLTDGHPVRIGITGGRDSRLLLSAAHHLGIVDSTFTIGAPDHPDVMIGRKVASTLGITHSSRNPVTSGLPPIGDLRSASARALSDFDLQRDAWAPNFQAGLRPGGQLSGYGGELLRGGFLKGQPETEHDGRYVQKQFEHYFFRFDDVLTPTARNAFRAPLESYLASAEGLLNPGSVLDECYLRLRCGVWAAASQMRFETPRMVPLCDNRLLRLVFSNTCTAQRANDALVKKLTNALAPELTDVETQTEVRASGNERARNLDVKSSNFWKYSAPIALAPEFGDVIFSSNAEAGGLWSVVSRYVFRELNTNGDMRGNPRIKQLWSIYSAAIACSGDWQRPQRATTVSLPANPDLYTTNWPKVLLRVSRWLDKHPRGAPLLALNAALKQCEVDLSRQDLILQLLGLQIRDGAVVDQVGTALTSAELSERVKVMPFSQLVLSDEDETES